MALSWNVRSGLTSGAALPRLDPLVALKESSEAAAGPIGAVGISGEPRRARRGERIRAAGRPGQTGIPPGLDQLVAFKPPESPVERPHIGVGEVEGSEPSGQLVAMILLLADEEEERGVQVPVGDAGSPSTMLTDRRFTDPPGGRTFNGRATCPLRFTAR